MSELFEEWASFLPDLLQGLDLSVEVTLLSLAIGIPCGLVLAVLVSSSSRLAKGAALLIVEFGGRRRWCCCSWSISGCRPRDCC